MKKAPGFLAPAYSLALILLLLLTAACGTEGAPDDEEERDDNGDRSSRVLWDRQSPEPDDRDGDEEEDGERTSSVFPGRPGATSEAPAQAVAATPSGLQSNVATGPPCPRRQPEPAVMLPPAETSPETDKEALLALFEATGGENWDGSGTWGGFSPIGEWQGVTTDEGAGSLAWR